MNAFANVEVTLDLRAYLIESSSGKTIAALKERSIVDHTVIVEVRARDHVDREAGVDVSNRGDLEAVNPAQ